MAFDNINDPNYETQEYSDQRGALGVKRILLKVKPQIESVHSCV